MTDELRRSRQITSGKDFDHTDIAVPKAEFNRFRRLRKVLNLPTALAMAYLTFVAILAVIGPISGFQDPNQQHLRDRLLPPLSETSNIYWLGTDHLGRDILSRSIWGARASAVIALPAVFTALTVGAGLGILAGYHGGPLDAVVMRIVEMQLAVPFLVMALVLVAVLGRSLGTLILTFAISEWALFARTTRSEVLQIRELPYIDAARSLGASHLQILYQHVMPNATTSALVLASLSVAKIIVAEASLSYLGIGVPPPTPSWGSIIADGRSYLDSAWWISAFPGIILLLVVLAVNHLGDSIRDILDPTLRNR